MIFETYSYRKKLAQRGGEPEVYTYNEMPTHLRHQICLALSEGIGRFHQRSGYNMHDVPSANDIWISIGKICIKEIESYLQNNESNPLDRYLTYLMNVSDIDDFLSALEVGCLGLMTLVGRTPSMRGASQHAESALEEINRRFEQHGVGYQFENRHIIKVDSKFVHSEIVKPTLQLLNDPLFAKANEEFLVAHKQYRAESFKDCVTASNRAFESALKAICDTERWPYDKGDRASELVTKVSKHGLFTHQFDKSLSAYVAMLKTGLPSVRNDAGGHGDGIAAAAVTAEIARFALNLTASNIMFLGECYSALKGRQSGAGLSRR